MAVVTTKSTSIINADSLPILAGTIGEYAPGMLRCASDVCAALTGDSTNSVYKLVRIPTTAKIKSVYLTSNVTVAGNGDISVFYSDSSTDGTNQSLGGPTNAAAVQISAADNKLFGAAQALTLANVRTDITFKNTFVPVASATTGIVSANYQDTPLWQVLVALGTTQFSADPGGFFDLCVKVTTGINTGGYVSLECYYVE